MDSIINDFLDPLMVSIHGDKYLNSPVIRLATLVYCMSLPSKLINDIISNKDGSSTVVVNLYPGISNNIPNTSQPINVLEELLRSTSDKLVKRINLPFKYVKQNHIKGAALMCSRVKKQLDCEMQVTTVTGSDLKFELVHNPSKRYISFTMSD
jgi:hypothetical protein